MEAPAPAEDPSKGVEAHTHTSACSHGHDDHHHHDHDHHDHDHHDHDHEHGQDHVHDHGPCDHHHDHDDHHHHDHDHHDHDHHDHDHHDHDHHDHDHDHSHDQDGHEHGPGCQHSHDHDHEHDHDHHGGSGHRTSAPETRGVDGRVYHSHDGLAPHTHEPLENAGSFLERAPPLHTRDFAERAFTVGIGGPVGTGKTALMLALCEALRDKYSVAAVTNDIFTREDGEFLEKHQALPPGRIRAVETGGCPHAAIREDISINLGPLEELSLEHSADLLLCESGGDNLAANFSRELADYIIYIIDVAGGDKIPRKGGPGITQADLLVINKTDLAEAVGADLTVMERDAKKIRDGGPMVFAQVKFKKSVPEIVDFILAAWEKATGQSRRT